MDAKSHQGNAACLRMIAESEAILGGGGGQIHNAEIPRGSTCLLIQARTHTFSSPGAHTHTHTHTACRARGGCCCGGVRCRVGPLLGRGSLFLFHGLCFPLMMGPLSVLPVDLHHSGLLIKPPFTKPKRGNKEGKREKGERKAVMEVWKGKGDRKREKQ